MKFVTLPPYQSLKYPRLVNNLPPMQWITSASAIVDFSPLLWLVNCQIIEGAPEMRMDW